MLDIVYSSIIFIAPAYVANATPVVVRGKRPIDFGRNFIDGRRIFGDGKTFEGFVIGVIAGTLVGLVLKHPLGLCLALSSGALIGDLVGAFVKRRLGLSRGRPAPGLDQLDFVVGALLLSSLVTEVSPMVATIILLITPPTHVATNRFAYMLKIKDTPW